MKSERDKESGKYRCDGAEKKARARLRAHLSRHNRHTFDIPFHCHQLPLPLRARQATQQELPEAHYRLDDAEHRFYCLLAQAVELAPPSRLEPMLHALQRTGRLGQRWRLDESLLPVWVMCVAPIWR